MQSTEKRVRICCPHCEKSKGFVEIDEEELDGTVQLMCLNCSNQFLINSEKLELYLTK